MKKLTVDFTKENGRVKPMHAVNNGPAISRTTTNLPYFREAGIPYGRTHDTSYYSPYGSNFVIDIVGIFPNFDADPYDEKSYDFPITDKFIATMFEGGVKPFYRLGNRIEHMVKKYGTLPPKDFKKWAVICEHIIRHYNYGWADGFHYDIEYWEIWNEPDLHPDDDPPEKKTTWGGTKLQFFELYHIAATHLKSCFPELKIGGPALACNKQWAEDFLKQLKAPLDFFSWHVYSNDPKKVLSDMEFYRALLDKYGYTKTESILNEWNYIRGWVDEPLIYSYHTIKNIKGASFIAAVMAEGQNAPLDILMYYDSRPSTFCGMFKTDIPCETLKGYYPFLMFNHLYRLGTAVETGADDDFYLCAAKGVGDDGKETGEVMLSYFNDDDDHGDTTVELALSGMKEGKKEVEFRILDGNRDCVLFRKDTVAATEYSAYLDLPLYAVVEVTVH